VGVEETKKSLSSKLFSFGMLRAVFFAALLFFTSCSDSFTPPIELSYTLTRDLVQKGVPIHIEAKGHYQAAEDGRWANHAEASLAMNGLEEAIHLKLLFISNTHEEWLISESSVLPGRQIYRFHAGTMHALSHKDEVEGTHFFGPADFNPIEIWNASKGAKTRLASGGRILTEEFLQLGLSQITLNPSFKEGAFQFIPAENDEILDGAELLGF